MQRLFLSYIFIISIAGISYSQIFSYSNDYAAIKKRSIDKKDDIYYPKLLKRFNVDDSTLTNYQVLCLLIGFTNDPNYHPQYDLMVEANIYHLNGIKEYSKALALADSFLVTHPVNQGTLIEISYSYYKLGNQQQAVRYTSKFYKIMKAMEYSGDGKSAETAIFSLGPADGQNYIKKYLGNRIGTMGSGRDKNNYFIDILESVSEDGKNRSTMYFNINHALSDFEKELEEASKK